MYSIISLKNELPDLIKRLDLPVTKWEVRPSLMERSIIYITYLDPQYGSLVQSAEITKKGEVYNPIMISKHLAGLFDWLNRMGYDSTRQNERTEIFKNELILKYFERRTVKCQS
jgi:hypothetical protein